MEIEFLLDNGATTPVKAHESDAGFDLCSLEEKVIYPVKDLTNEQIDNGFDTGVHVNIPDGYVGYVQGRSGLNIKHNIICPTGTVDAGYTGSIRVKLYNLSSEPYHVRIGDRIAQLVIQPVVKCNLIRVNRFDDTERGDNGFGSTGR